MRWKTKSSKICSLRIHLQLRFETVSSPEIQGIFVYSVQNNQYYSLKETRERPSDDQQQNPWPGLSIKREDLGCAWLPRSWQKIIEVAAKAKLLWTVLEQKEDATSFSTIWCHYSSLFLWECLVCPQLCYKS